MKSVRLPIFSTDGETLREALVDECFALQVVRITLRRGTLYPDVRFRLNLGEYTQPLHHRAYDLSPGAATRPRQKGFEVHHRNRNTFDARGSNLVLMATSDHKALTVRDQQRVTFRKAEDLSGGWWRPRSPARVRQTVAAPMKSAEYLAVRRRANQQGMLEQQQRFSPAQQLLEISLEASLAQHRALPELRPNIESRVPATLKPFSTDVRANTDLPRLGPTPGELAAAMCWVEHAGDLDQMTECLGVEREVLRLVVERLPVMNSLLIWRSYRRWPKPTPLGTKRKSRSPH